MMMIPMLILIGLMLSVTLALTIANAIALGELKPKIRRLENWCQGIDGKLNEYGQRVDTLLNKPGNPIERRMVAEALADMADEDLAAGELARTIVQTPGRLNPKLRQDGSGGPAMKVLDEAYRRAKLYEDIDGGGLSVVEITPITEVGTDGEVDLQNWDGSERAHLVRDPTIGNHGDRDDVR